MIKNFKVGMTFENGRYEIVKVTKCYVTVNEYYHTNTKEVKATKRCKIVKEWGTDRSYEACFFSDTTLEVEYNDQNTTEIEKDENEQIQEVLSKKTNQEVMKIFNETIKENVKKFCINILKNRGLYLESGIELNNGNIVINRFKAYL